MQHANDHSTHALAEHRSDHVEDTLPTRIIGIIFGILLVVVAVSIQRAMGWPPVVGGILTGILGVVFGASGTSVFSPQLASIYGWGGGIAFFASIAMFVGLGKLFMF